MGREKGNRRLNMDGQKPKKKKKGKKENEKKKKEKKKKRKKEERENWKKSTGKGRKYRINVS